MFCLDATNPALWTGPPPTPLKKYNINPLHSRRVWLLSWRWSSVKMQGLRYHDRFVVTSHSPITTWHPTTAVRLIPIRQPHFYCLTNQSITARFPCCDLFIHSFFLWSNASHIFRRSGSRSEWVKPFLTTECKVLLRWPVIKQLDQPEISNLTHISMCRIWTTSNFSYLWKKNIISDEYFERFSNVSNNGGPYPYFHRSNELE